MADFLQSEVGRIPAWNGDPATFKSYEQQVMLFRMTADLKKDRNYCALLISALTGAAQESALQMPSEQWQPVKMDEMTRDLNGLNNQDKGDIAGRRKEIKENTTERPTWKASRLSWKSWKRSFCNQSPSRKASGCITSSRPARTTASEACQ